jgi:putative transposase
MSDCRRNRVPDGTYFFTVNLLDRSSRLLVTHIDPLRDAARDARARALFHIDARVVPPEHIHCVWTPPPGDDDFSGRWRALKKVFSNAIPPGESRSPVRRDRGERGIWQRRFCEHTIRDERDYASHVGYVQFNPVKHGLVAHPGAWPHSSLQRCVAAGLYPADWSYGGSTDADWAKRC